MSDRKFAITKADDQAHQVMELTRQNGNNPALVADYDAARRKGHVAPMLALLQVLDERHRRVIASLEDRIEALEARPGVKYLGVHQAGQSYQPGDMVTRSGGMWHCEAPTTDTPGEGSKAWRLAVKRGRVR
jgi:hypothetical protein